MALTAEQLVLQMDILASKTDEATNPNMAFKSNATLNKGLNPAYFSGNYTKIVNALNKLAATDETVTKLAQDTASLMNSILLDTTTPTNAETWNTVKSLMGKDTIIEGIQEILTGNRQQQILNISSDDIGKVLAIAKNEKGEIITKAVEIAGIGEAIKAEDIVYHNPDRPEFSNVSDALTYILNNEGNNSGGGNGGNDIIASLDWENITNKPKIPTKLVMTETQLCMQTEEENLSAVELLTDSDIDLIFANLD